MQCLQRQRRDERGDTRLSWLLALATATLLAGALAGALVILARWPTPPSWLALARHWTRAHLLTAPSMQAFGAIGALAVALLALWVGRRPRLEALVDEQQQTRDRAVMLHLVRYKVDDLLEQSLHRAVRLELGLIRRPDAVELGTLVRGHPAGRRDLVPPETRIAELFDRIGGGLLILGRPGAGKTILLLQLAQNLLDRAEHDPALLIPVYLNLSSWGHRRPSFDQWLVDQLVITYRVPRRTAQIWVERGMLLPLLDGLDEVVHEHRASCVTRINAYRTEGHGLARLAVCSRTEGYQQLTTRLQFDEAIEIQPLGDEQVDAYLDALELAGTPLDQVRATRKTDPDLAELLRSPLLLHVIALAYHGRAASELTAPGASQKRQARLWAAYLERMFEERPPQGRYSNKQAVDWLSWLARSLHDRGQTEFYLDRLTLDWLPSRTRPLAMFYMLFAVFLVGGLVGELIGYPALGFGNGFILGVIALVGAEYTPLEERSAWVELRSQLDEVASNERGSLLFILACSLLFGLAIAVTHGPVVGLIALAAWLVMILVYFLIGALISWLALSLSYFKPTDERARPNEGVHRSVRNASIGALVGALAGGLVGSLASARLFWLRFTIAGGLVGALLFGFALIKHYAIRSVLVRHGAMPRRYALFLEAMRERLLLQRSGGAYQFIHLQLREHLVGPQGGVPTSAGDQAPDTMADRPSPAS